MLVPGQRSTNTCGFLAGAQQELLVPGQEPTMVVGSWPGTNKCWFLTRNQHLFVVPGPAQPILVWAKTTHLNVAVSRPRDMSERRGWLLKSEASYHGAPPTPQPNFHLCVNHGVAQCPGPHARALALHDFPHLLSVHATCVYFFLCWPFLGASRVWPSEPRGSCLRCA